MNSKKSINVGFIGNPNCGKTTLFNAFTGGKPEGGQLARRNRRKKRRHHLLSGTGVPSHRPARHLQPDVLFHGGDGLTGMHHERRSGRDRRCDRRLQPGAQPLSDAAASGTRETCCTGSEHDGYRGGAGHGAGSSPAYSRALRRPSRFPPEKNPVSPS